MYNYEVRIGRGEGADTVWWADTVTQLEAIESAKDALDTFDTMTVLDKKTREVIAVLEAE